jgi:hypothetical protein
VLLGLFALTLADSINPSAIAVTLYLLSRERVPAHVIVPPFLDLDSDAQSQDVLRRIGIPAMP